MSFYYETFNPRGGWNPVKVSEKPVLKGPRIAINGGIGALVRPDSIMEINKGHEELSLKALQMRYGRDGSLWGTQDHGKACAAR